ncbi:hypothetical protein M8C21_021185 [Ambrosia artemisiifolia]|uniref:Uncharacterized protein n=1 Tax=Ambrosia artemisiifolia TaxID=4212 RepID=A0AAD5G3N2_AMBAR|nr:hypothetical protein M8C21_021185 [Ambrosia artemisiifolia]
MCIKRTYQPNNLRRRRVHGYLARSNDTQARMLADEIGSWHLDESIDSSSDVDEGSHGYLTKFSDGSSVDMSPISYLRICFRWTATHLGFYLLAEIEPAPPTVALKSIRSNYSQLDEVDMGMTYDELLAEEDLRIWDCDHAQDVHASSNDVGVVTVGSSDPKAGL